MWIKNKEIMVCIGYGKYLGVSIKDQSFVLYEKGEIVKEVVFIRCSMIILSIGNYLSFMYKVRFDFHFLNIF